MSAKEKYEKLKAKPSPRKYYARDLNRAYRAMVAEREATGAGKKIYNEMGNVGAVKYLVNFHDGEKTHEDGSPFFDIRCFSNQAVKERFIRDLRQQGYAER